MAVNVTSVWTGPRGALSLSGLRMKECSEVAPVCGPVISGRGLGSRFGACLRTGHCQPLLRASLPPPRMHWGRNLEMPEENETTCKKLGWGAAPWWNDCQAGVRPWGPSPKSPDPETLLQSVVGKGTRPEVGRLGLCLHVELSMGNVLI